MKGEIDQVQVEALGTNSQVRSTVPSAPTWFVLPIRPVQGRLREQERGRRRSLLQSSSCVSCFASHSRRGRVSLWRGLEATPKTLKALSSSSSASKDNQAPLDEPSGLGKNLCGRGPRGFQSPGVNPDHNCQILQTHLSEWDPSSSTKTDGCVKWVSNRRKPLHSPVRKEKSNGQGLVSAAWRTEHVVPKGKARCLGSFSLLDHLAMGEGPLWGTDCDWMKHHVMEPVNSRPLGNSGSASLVFSCWRLNRTYFPKKTFAPWLIIWILA